jgi:hypothetical protein
MPKEQITNKIAAIDVLRKPTGMYLDGAGLYLQVSANKRRSWIFRFTSPTRDKVRDMGLGPTHTISLAQTAKRIGLKLKRMPSRSTKKIMAMLM